MRKDKNSCKKNHESTIGKIIYGFLLFMPLLAIATNCLYSIFNKNAYENYSGNNQNEYTQTLITNLDNLEINNTYLFDSYSMYIDSQTNLGAWAYTINVTNLRILNSTTPLTQPQENVKAFSLYYNTTYNNRAQIQFTYNDNTTYVYSQQQSVKFTFEYLSDNMTVNWAQYNLFYKITYNNNYYLDNAFYYSVDKVEESNLFNWAKNSIVYNTLETTCNQLSITTSFIPMLLAYWLIISVIYFLYDIALLLIWSAHDKIHELRDSL